MWRDTLERAVWTGLQAPAAVALVDLVSEKVVLPPTDLLKAALFGFALSALKSVGKDRLAYLTRKGKHS